MEEALFEKKLADLIEELRHVPVPSNTRPLLTRRPGGRKHTQKLSRTPETISDGMDFLRISVKYLLFDLEATRRENAALKRLIDNEP